MDFGRITHPLRLASGSHQPGSGKGCAMNVIADGAFNDPRPAPVGLCAVADHHVGRALLRRRRQQQRKVLRDRDGLGVAARLERLVRPLLRWVNHSSEEIHVGDPQAGDQPRTRTTDRKTPPSTQAALSSGVYSMNYSETYGKRWRNRGSLVIGKVLVGAVGAVISVGLAAPAGASPLPQQHTPQDFLAAVRAAGITGTDPAMLGDGYQVCWELWNQHAAGSQVAAGLVRDYRLTTDEAAHFVLAAYDDLCPVPGSYDYWAYSTS
jgi:Protein of unknown function (DUF732)